MQRLKFEKKPTNHGIEIMVKYGMKTSCAKLIFVAYRVQHTWEYVWATGAITLLCIPG